LNIKIISDLKLLKTKGNDYWYSPSTISSEDIPLQLMILPLNKNELRLSWDIKIRTIDCKHVWGIKVDASNGAIIQSQDYI